MIKFEKQKGNFIKHCPCSPEAISCGYFNLNLHTGCPYSCSYCILQDYLETKDPIFFTNIDDMEKELLRFTKKQKCLRIGTGELSDSLAFDAETKYSNKILSIFENFPEIIFEFKTKSININSILKYKKVLKNIVVSWSLNPQIIIEREEHFCPDLNLRLKAIAKVQSKGYKIGLHFDPIIVIENWKSYYRSLIMKISKIINPQNIAWWSMGTLRFPHSLRKHIFKFKDSLLFSGELIKGYDGKYRYFKPIRIEVFKFIKQEIQSIISDKTPLYLCMEDIEVWEEIFPEICCTESKINKYLYESACK